MEFSVFVHCGVLSMFTYLIISNKTYLAVIATAQLLEFWASQITNSKKHKLDWNPVLSSNFNITNLLSWDLVYQGVIYVTFIFSRRPVLSTDQGIPSCFYFRISWILLEQRCFYFFLSPRVSGGPQKPQTLTASKSKYEKFGPKI